jgi:hypothetical protein
MSSPGDIINMHQLKHQILDKRLLQNIKNDMHLLEPLYKEISDHWSYEDYIYRFYHHSFKVYWLQDVTERILYRLNKLMPEEFEFEDGWVWKREYHRLFAEILAEGTGKKFDYSHNKEWSKHTRPILEAFFHAKYFLEMAIKYGKELDSARDVLPSGWAGLLCLFNMR